MSRHALESGCLRASARLQSRRTIVLSSLVLGSFAIMYLYGIAQHVRKSDAQSDVAPLKSLRAKKRRDDPPVAPTTSLDTPIESDIAVLREEVVRDAYHVFTTDDGDKAQSDFCVENPAHSFRVRFSVEGVSVASASSESSAWEWRWTLQGFGREQAEPLSRRAHPEATDNKVSYQHFGIAEWYVNSASGLEQGFEISNRPSGDGELVLEGSVTSDLGLSQAGEEATITARDDRGWEVMRYGELHAYDSRKTPLPARMELADNRVRLLVDDSSAIYPVTIDPLVTTPAWYVDGEETKAAFGLSLSGAGDVNGDGFADIVVGSPGYSTNRGRAYLFLGSPTGPSKTPAWKLSGGTAGESFGSSVAAAGDVNGDGFSDVVIGAPDYSSSTGKAYVFHGAASGLALSPTWTAVGATAGDKFGSAVSSAGDANKDGKADIIVGAPGYDTVVNLGGGLTVPSTDTPKPIPDSNGGVPGVATSVIQVGTNLPIADLNVAVNISHTYRSDLIVEITSPGGTTVRLHNKTGGSQDNIQWTYDDDGANPPDGPGSLAAFEGATAQGIWTLRASDNAAQDTGTLNSWSLIFQFPEATQNLPNAGKAYVFAGSASGPASAAVWSAVGDAADAGFGSSLACAGDVNGDSYSDVILNAGLGRAYTYHGSASGLGTSPARSLSLSAGQYTGASSFGKAVAGAGDMNGDGYADVVVGAPSVVGDNTNLGQAFFFLGGVNGVSSNFVAYRGPTCSVTLDYGASVTGLGDVDGDGLSDVGVSPGTSPGGTGCAVYNIFNGTASGVGSTILAVDIPNTFSSDFTRIAAAGDVNGDGFGDIIVSLEEFGGYLGNEGRVSLYYGSPSSNLISSTVTWTASGKKRIRSVGDTNGDGFMDFAAGSGVHIGASAGPASAPVWTTASSSIDANGVGDVNGDGYTDIGAGASIFPGAPSGPSTTAIWFVAAGFEVQGIGDVNGDGYADVAEGPRAYWGSPSGPETIPSWTNPSVQDLFGVGDINRDGYADVMDRTGNVFYGSSTGLSNTPIPTVIRMPFGPAGDVNGDGFGDIVMGDPAWAVSQQQVSYQYGRVFIFLGSAAGVSTTPDFSAVGKGETDYLGRTVSAAGDINGDGYDDVVASYDKRGTADSTRVFLGAQHGFDESTSYDTAVGVGVGDIDKDGRSDIVVLTTHYDPININTVSYYSVDFYSLDTSGQPWRSPRQFKIDGTSLPQGGLTGSINSVRLQLFGLTPQGRSRVKLEWEIRPYGVGFDGSASGRSVNWTDTGLAGATLSELVGGLEPTNGHVWRARLLFDPSQNPRQLHSLWYSPQWPAPSGADFYTVANYAPPTPPVIDVTPDSSPTAPTTDENLVCAITTPGKVYQGFSPYYTYRWTNGSLVINRGPTSSTTDTLDDFYTQKGETWSCAVRCWDEHQYSTEVVEAVQIVNSPPTSASLTIPATISNASNLVCTVLAPSNDADGDTIQYDFDWHVKRIGQSSFTLFRNGSLNPSTSSQIDLLDTFPGDTWYCIATPNDGSANGFSSTSNMAYVNSPPQPITVTVTPLAPSPSDALTCTVVSPAEDAEDDLISYTFDWYTSANGVTFVGPVRSITTTELTDSLSADTESGGEFRRCRVTSFDGNDYGSPAEDTVQILQDSSISCAVNPTVITLGQAITVSGSITPKPGPGAAVFFTSTTPAGLISSSFPEGLTIGDGIYSRTFHPTAASVQAGLSPWSIQAAWSGDSRFQAAASTAVSFTVLKAQPTLTVELSATSAPLNLVGVNELIARVEVSAPLPEQLASLLEGRLVQLVARDPYGSTPSLTATTTLEQTSTGVISVATFDLVHAGFTFDTPGAWQFQANIDEDSNFLRAVSPGYNKPDTARLIIKDKAGYAILVVGKLDNNGEGQPEHTKTMDFVYRTFVDRGFDPGTLSTTGDIYYLREGDAQPAPGIVVDDVTPSQADLQFAIETWAAQKMNAAPAPLFVVFVDHGSSDAFYVYSGSGDETRIITPIELDSYFDALDATLNSDAKAQTKVFVYGACRSASFIPSLSAANRVLITSASPDEISYRGERDPSDPADVRDGEPFITELFRNAASGKALKESFEFASEKNSEYTASNGSGSVAPQTPLLDDNGDGVGTPGGQLTIDPDEANRDGGLAHELVLGYGSNAAGSIGWQVATVFINLLPSESEPLLEARADQSPATGHTAWIAIKTPDWQGAVLPENGLDLFQREFRLPTFLYSPEISDIGNGYFRWSSFDGVFSGPGTYKVYYFIKDGVTGETSTHLLTTVYRGVADNQPPASVTSLVYPAQNAVVSTTTFFAWDPVLDPEGDDVTYRIEVSEDAAFSVISATQDGVRGTLVQLPGLQDLRTYYWRVIPVDEYGSAAVDNLVQQFYTNNGNPGTVGQVTGLVKDVSGQPIADALVQVKRSSQTISTTTSKQGRYFVDLLDPGLYSVRVSKAGYQPYTKSSVSVSGGNTTQVSTITLGAVDAPFLWGDVSADAHVGTVDASLILQWIVGIITSFPVDESKTAPSYPEAANVDGATLDTEDATTLLKWKVGRIAQFPRDTNGDGYGPDTSKSSEQSSTVVASRTVSLPDDLSGAPGEILDVPVSIDDATDVTSFFVSFTYDTSALEIVSVHSGVVMSGGIFVPNLQTAGVVKIAAASDSPAVQSGALATIRVRVLNDPSACSSSLAFESATLNGGAVPVITDSGSIHVEGVLAGDLDGDCSVSATDIQLVINSALGISVGPSADVTLDGLVDALDVQTIINVVLDAVKTQ